MKIEFVLVCKFRNSRLDNKNQRENPIPPLIRYDRSNDYSTVITHAIQNDQ